MTILAPELLEKLACPACAHRPPLRLQGDYLVCDACRRAYPIREGIPVLLVEKATFVEQLPSEAEDSPNSV